MKTKYYLILTLTIICAAFCPQANGQTYYNFALGAASGTGFHQAHSIIRPIDNQSAVAYYGGPGFATSVLVYINLNPLTISELTLNEYSEVKDIRIVNGVVFFCGRETSSYQGFIGHVTVSDLANATPNSIKCYKIPTGPTIMWRMAAYDDGTGDIRVVCLGKTQYELSNSIFDPCPLYSICQVSFFVECTYTGIIQPNVIGKVVSNSTRFERADDVVVTDNWLAIVSYFPAQDEIIIHRCSKNNVAATFDNNFYCYPMPYLEGLNHCCHMKGDTIADALLYCTAGTGPYESHLRIFDLNTMTMTSAQRFPLLEKAEPQEVVYLPNYATLVTLQYQMYPLGDLHHTFVHWKPYNATPYNANLMRESQYDLSFQTVDKLTPKHIIAAGGDYWFMKDILYDDPSTTCYKTATQQVSGLQLSSPVLNSNNYGNFSLYLTPIPTGSINPVTLNLDCNTP